MLAKKLTERNRSLAGVFIRIYLMEASRKHRNEICCFKLWNSFVFVFIFIFYHFKIQILISLFVVVIWLEDFERAYSYVDVVENDK